MAEGVRRVMQDLKTFLPSTVKMCESAKGEGDVLFCFLNG